MQALNQLISSGSLATLQTTDGQLIFRLQSQEEAAKLNGLTAEDRLVLQEIEKSANDAIATKELRYRAGSLPQQTLTKILKKLEGRQLIKPVKSVNAGNVKKYMLFGLTPSKEITGGPWYHDGEFDYSFIRALQNLAVSFLQREPHITTAAKFHEFIHSTNILKGQPQLRVADVEAVLVALVYDAKLEEAPTPDDEKRYRLIDKLTTIDELVKPFTSVPSCDCLTCRGVVLEPACTVVGAASNQRYIACRNMDAWLEKVADQALATR